MKVKKILIALSILVLLIPNIAAQAGLPSEENPMLYMLGAGINQFDTGSVSIWFAGGTVYVHYQTNEPWELTAVHAIAVHSLDEIPVSNPVCRCPQFGHFPYGENFSEPVTEHTAELNVAWDQSGPLYVMAHAALVDAETSSTETAFAHGTNFGSGRFAYYITLLPEGEGNGNDDPQDPEECFWYPHPSGINHTLMANAWNGSIFVVAGEDGSIFTSPTGEEWTQRSSGVNNNIHGVAWGNGIFVAVGRAGTILTSVDGIIWEDNSPVIPVEFLAQVIWNGSMFIVAGEQGTILTSANGINWTPQTTGTTEFLTGLAWDGAQLVAVGAEGTIITSPDGINWLAQTSGTSAMLHDIIWANDKFVAVGGSSRIILTSDNGTIWTEEFSNDSTSLRRVAWTGQEYVAVGGAGEIVSSEDGSLWRTRTSGTDQQLYDIVVGNEQYLVVGTLGTTLLRVCEVVFDDAPVDPELPEPEVLPVTGTNIIWFVALGLILMLAGVAFIKKFGQESA